MSEERLDSSAASDQSPNNPHDQGNRTPIPYERLLSGVVAKIRDQPFLFVIAVAALIIGMVVLGAGRGSSDLRFVVVVIASLAVLVIAGYYTREGARIAAKARKAADPSGQHAAAPRQQRIEVAEGGRLDGARQESTQIDSQEIVVSGNGTFARDLIQASTNSPSDEKAQT